MHHWLELDNNPRQLYLDDFNRQKIVYSEIVRSPQFYLDTENFVPEATAFLMSGAHLEYLIKFLNSNAVAWLFKTYYAGGGLGDDGYRYKKAFLVNLPVPKKFESYGYIVIHRRRDSTALWAKWRGDKPYFLIREIKGLRPWKRNW